jgi:hypothetical protein
MKNLFCDFLQFLCLNGFVELTKQTLPIEDVGDTLWNGIDIQEKG